MRPEQRLTQFLLLFAFIAFTPVHAESASDPTLCADAMGAAEVPSEELTRFIDVVDRCPSVEASFENGWTDMHWAALLNLPNLIQRLHAAGLGIDVRTAGDSGKFSEPLIDRIQSAETLQLASPPVNPAAYFNFDYTPLHWAAWSQSLLATEMILQLGAGINSRTTAQVTPLHLAVWVQAFDVAELIVQNGGDLGAQTNDGASPLHWAVKADNEDIAKLLIDAGADIHATAQHEATPLHWAAMLGSTETARLLIDFKADVNAKSVKDVTPLHLAAWFNRLTIAEMLVDNGADFKARTEDGQLPIQGAIANAADATTEFLLGLEK